MFLVLLGTHVREGHNRYRRAGLDGVARFDRFSPFNTVRCDIEGPGQDYGQRKTKGQQAKNERYRIFRQADRWKHDIGDLQHDEGTDYVGDTDLEYFAVF